MPVKKFNTRIKNKIDTKTNLSAFVPMAGELVIGGETNQSSTIDTNSQAKPYIAKIGDGSTDWAHLPVLGNDTIIGQNDTYSNLGNGDARVSLTIPSGNKMYSVVEIASNANIDQIDLAFTGTSPFLGEHYVLIKNNSNADVYFNGINSAVFNTNNQATVSTRQNWIAAGDICEVQIKIFMIGNNYYLTAIPQLGIMQTITTSGDENIWNVNRY